jgi:hypothetical protein
VKAAHLDVAEARAILFADETLDDSWPQREAAGRILGFAEADAWRNLVDAARARIAAHENPPPPFEIVPYPGGNEPDLQTLFMEAMATGKAAKKDAP